MCRTIAAILAFCLVAAPGSMLAAQNTRAPIYFPDRFGWEHKKPEEVGMNAAKLDEAVKAAIANETQTNKKSMLNYLATTFGASEPFDTPIGPVKDRAPANGFILRHGFIVAGMAMARTPGPANKYYGFANWYLNTDRAVVPNAPASAVRFVGNGSNIVYIDWDNDIVAVVRWIRNDAALNDVVGKMLGTIEDPER